MNLSFQSFQKNLVYLLLSALLVMAGPYAHADDRPPISVGVGDFFYRIGGGRVLPKPSTNANSMVLNVHYSSGMSYSCGKFDFHSNISQMINQFMTRLRQIPGQLMDAFSAAVAGLPNYLLMKANPSLYNIITKTLDETTELFRLSYKSCEQIESEMRNDPNANPYDNFLQASIAGQWIIGEQSGQPIPDVKENIDKNPARPIVIFDNKVYGTESRPIQPNFNLTVVGYNLMIGRTGMLTAETSPTYTHSDLPIVKMWGNPREAGLWAASVLGDIAIVMEGDHPQTRNTTASKGLRPTVELFETQIYDAFMKAYLTSDYSDMQKYPSAMALSGSLVKALRTLPEGQAAVVIERLVSEMAVREAQERIFLIRQIIEMAMHEPGLQNSKAYGAMNDYIRKKSFPQIRVVANEIGDDLALKERTTNKTTLKILDYAEALRMSGLNSDSGSATGESHSGEDPKGAH